MPFYAVANGRSIGIFRTWSECKESVEDFKSAKYKKFETLEEAQEFIKNGSSLEKSDEVSLNIDYYVYTDGACSNNGKPDAIAGIGIYFGLDDPRNVSRRIDGKQTNNAAELTAIIEAFNIIKKDLKKGKKIAIVSDSEYAIRCATSYGEKCAKNNWENDIPNKELVQLLYDTYSGTGIKFIHVMAHTDKTDPHSLGNDGADKLANMAIGLDSCPYEKIYLVVPFANKDEVKSLGAKWDPEKKKWYINSNSSNKEQILQNFQQFSK